MMFGKRKSSSPRQDPAQAPRPAAAQTATGASNGTAGGPVTAPAGTDAPPRRQAARPTGALAGAPAAPRDEARRPQPSAAAGSPVGTTPTAAATQAGANVAQPRGGAEDDGVDASRKLVVGRGISLSGQIKTCEKLVVEGKVQANLTDCVTLVIADSGLFNGSARVQDAEISGCFEGDLVVFGRLYLRSSGILEGTIKYADLEIERGGKIAGTVDLIDDPVAAASELLIDEDEAEDEPASAERDEEPSPEAIAAEQDRESAAQETRQGRLKIG